MKRYSQSSSTSKQTTSQAYRQQQLRGRIENPTLKRILAVDDDDDINLVVLDSFAEPLAALQNFKADLFDLLIIDIMMSVWNSLYLYQEIRIAEDKFNFF
ncbi:MAG: hypothetical protein M3Y53_11570 [Thermoproteota archaeon]|nr:hypothetical protein [Thermoproteota archaeon]